MTSVVTRHQSSTLPTPLLSPHQVQSSHARTDDYTSGPARIQRNTYRNYVPPQSPLSYPRQNPNQSDRYINQPTPLLPQYRPNIEQNTKTIPILQRLFQAQQRQQ